MTGADGRPEHPAGPDALVAAFRAWAASERAAGAAAARSRERWLRQQAAESATWVGTLVDLAEAGADVALTVGQRTLAGRIAAVGHDLCVLSDSGGGSTIVALAHVQAVRVPESRWAPAAFGDRAAPLEIGLADALELLAAERSAVRIVLAGGEVLAGELAAVGVDVVTLDVAGARRRAHLPLAAVETCSPAGGRR